MTDLDQDQAGRDWHVVFPKQQCGLAHAVAEELWVRLPTTPVLVQRMEDEHDDTDALVQRARLRCRNGFWIRIALPVDMGPGWSEQASIMEMVCECKDQLEMRERIGRPLGWHERTIQRIYVCTVVERVDHGHAVHGLQLDVLF